MSTTPSATPLRRRAALAVAGLTLASLGAGPVHADVAVAARGKAEVKTSISLTQKKQKLTGKVSSRKRACRSRREVSLNWRPPGASKFEEVRTPSTNRRGVWIISAQQRTIPQGKYVAKTSRTKACKASTSRTITVR